MHEVRSPRDVDFYEPIVRATSILVVHHACCPINLSHENFIACIPYCIQYDVTAWGNQVYRFLCLVGPTYSFLSIGRTHAMPCLSQAPFPPYALFQVRCVPTRLSLSTKSKRQRYLRWDEQICSIVSFNSAVWQTFVNEQYKVLRTEEGKYNSPNRAVGLP